MFETLKADDISLQQIEFSINQEKKELEELYNDIAVNVNVKTVKNVKVKTL